MGGLAMTKTLVVAGCFECPMVNWEWFTCQHPSLEPLVELRCHHFDEGGVPDACPLRTEPVHIHLKPQVPQ